MLSSLATAPDAVDLVSAHVWRANQLACAHATVIPTGSALLDRELPGGGWPAASLIELLVEQPGVGEMCLLLPALRQLAGRRIALVQPPHLPQAAAWMAADFPVQSLLWVRAQRAADALWAAEKIVHSGACGGVLLWQSEVRGDNLRRLQLAAQASDLAFWLLRPISCAQQASPAPLRLALQPAAAGISIRIVKRRGPHRDEALVLPLEGMAKLGRPIPDSEHVFMDRRSSAPAAARSVSSALA